MTITVSGVASSVLTQALSDSGVGVGQGLRLEGKGQRMMLTLDSPRESDRVVRQDDRVVLIVDGEMERAIGDATIDVDTSQGQARLVIRRNLRDSGGAPGA